MLSGSQMIIDQKLYNNLSINNLNIFWKGFIFIPGLEDGKESLAFYFREYPNYEDNIEKLFGSFILIIKDNALNQTICFSDNSGFTKIYRYKNLISDSFLSLINHIKATKKDLDYGGIAEFIRLGYCFDKTFIKDVSIINKRLYIKWKTEQLSIISKNLKPITYQGTNFNEYFQCLSETLANRRIICDLTGGTDSRMLVALLEHNEVKYDISLSGREDYIDMKICKEICNTLGKNPKLYNYVEEYNDNVISVLFNACDAQYPILESYRNYYYDKNLSNDGFDLRLTGINGELFKDAAWPKPYIVFPEKSINYFWKNNCKKFRKNYTGLTNKMINEIEKVNIKILNIKKEYKLGSVTKSTDNYIYENIMFYQASNFNILASNAGIKQYSPLLEYDVARVGFNLNPKKRLLIRFHREVITKNCPQIAKIRTDNNFTCLNSRLYILRDFFVNINNFIRQVFHVFFKASQLMTTGATGELIYKKAKENLVDSEIILKQYGIINEDFDLTKANDVIFDRLLTIGIFLQYLKE